jgi:hypothetical protein
VDEPALRVEAALEEQAVPSGRYMVQLHQPRNRLLEPQ